jgi:hypothetical protein
MIVELRGPPLRTGRKNACVEKLYKHAKGLWPAKVISPMDEPVMKFTWVYLLAVVAVVHPPCSMTKLEQHDQQRRPIDLTSPSIYKRQARGTIHELTQLVFKMAHEWTWNTGQGVKETDPHGFWEYVKKLCPHYEALEPIMGDRAAVKPLASTEDLDSSSSSSDSVGGGGCGGGDDKNVTGSRCKRDRSGSLS